MNVDGTRIRAHLNRAAWLLPLVLAMAVLLYLPRLSAPFIFDDLGTITANPYIRHLWPLSRAMSAPEQTPLAGRPIVSLSLALNYAIGGLDVRGYHAFNLIAHLAVSALLFAIVRRALQSPVLGGRYERSAGRLALVVTAIWTLHPLQTESVIYVIQRTELLMALFCLLTLYCSIRGHGSRGPWGWHAAAIAACALGMASKEVMVSAPLLVLLYDRVFMSPSFRAALGRRPLFYAALASTWIVLGVLLASGPRSESIGFGHGVTALDYLRTQAGVILWYLRLSIWPHPLVISYDDWPIARSFIAAAYSGLAVLALVVGSLWAVVRRRPIGFLGAWFFLILAPTSSFVPIVTEVAAERRMYLPLVTPVVICVLAGHRLLGYASERALLKQPRLEWFAGAATIAVAATLACLTYARGRDYRTDLALWQDAVTKRPRNAVAHVNLGNALFRRGEVGEALRCYETALAIKPEEAKAHNNLASALVQQNRIPAALAHYQEALRLRPRYANAHYNLAIALSKLGRTDEEIAHYLEALRITPDHIGACNNLGMALVREGEIEKALPYYQRALKVDPDFAVLRRNLADALLKLGRLDQAATEYRKVLAINPDHAGAHCGLGITLAMQGRTAEAIAELREALRLDPNQPEARRLLQELLAQQRLFEGD